MKGQASVFGERAAGQQQGRGGQRQRALLGQDPEEQQRVTMAHDKVEGVSHEGGATPRIPVILTLFANTAEYFIGGYCASRLCILAFVYGSSSAIGVGRRQAGPLAYRLARKPGAAGRGRRGRCRQFLGKT